MSSSWVPTLLARHQHCQIMSCTYTESVCYLHVFAVQKCSIGICHFNMAYMWHDQGEWVTCRQFQILIFQYKSLVHLKCYIFILISLQFDIWFWRYEQFFNFKNNVKHKKSSPLLACISKSIFPTSDSFLWSCHIWETPVTSMRLQAWQTHIFWVFLNILCMCQRASWTYPPQVFTSVYLFNKIVRSGFTINSPLFQNNWVKIHHRKSKVEWRFTKLICFF